MSRMTTSGLASATRRQTGPPVDGLDDRVATQLERAAQLRPHQRLVVDDQHLARAGGVPRASGAARRLRRDPAGRQQHREAASAPRFTLDQHRPAMGRDDAQAGRQAQAVAPLLGREERLEHPASRRFVHPGTVVLHLDQHPVPWLNRGADRAVPAGIDLGHVSDAHVDDAGAVAQRVRCVGQQVHQHLAQGGPIAHHHAARLHGHLQVGLLRQRGAQQLAQLVQQHAQIDRLALAQVAVARIGQHLPGQRPPLLRGRDHGVRSAPAGRPLASCARRSSAFPSTPPAGC